jgi:hypothetical protein
VTNLTTRDTDPGRKGVCNVKFRFKLGLILGSVPFLTQ